MLFLSYILPLIGKIISRSIWFFFDKVLYFDGIGIEPFLDKQYGDYKSKDFFSKDVTWYDKYNKGTHSQRLDGVVFYK